MPNASDTTMNVHVSTNSGVASFKEVDPPVLDEMKHGQRFDEIAVEQEIEDEPGHDQRCKQAGGHADGEGHAEALDFAGAHVIQNHGR